MVALASGGRVAREKQAARRGWSPATIGTTGHVAVAKGQVAGGIEEEDLEGVRARADLPEDVAGFVGGLHEGRSRPGSAATNNVEASAPHLVLRFQNSAATITGDMAAKPEKA